LPINAQAEVADDKFIQAGFQMLSETAYLAQFFDRDAPAEMASLAMEGFQEFMVMPDNLDAILQRLETARERIYAQQ
jgi:multiple sugar transport system substrate-binding protein